MAALLPSDHPWSSLIRVYDTVESTNTLAKQLAQSGAPHGTCILARHQTGGRGRMGRSFSSPEGLGMYLSVILRPHCPPAELMGLTCAVGVAACDGVAAVCKLQPGLKWINDLVCNRRKLGGILCELSMDAAGQTAFAIVGIGINCLQTQEDFPPQLHAIATSLLLETGAPVQPDRLAAAVIDALSKMPLPPRSMDRYRSLCVTLGQPVQVVRGEESYRATALSVDEEGGLVVELPNGQIRTVNSGEVSVRGLYGYHP